MIEVSIAGLLIKIDTQSSYGIKEFAPFFSKQQEDIHLKISLNACKYISKPNNEIVLDEQTKWLKNYTEDEEFSAYVYREDLRKVKSMIKANKKWSNITARYVKNKKYYKNGLSGPLGDLIFRNTILFHQGIVVHAAAIDWQGKGIIFSAPSGTGKSTQAGLWRKYMGASIINGDRPALRMIDEQPYVFGTPWSGAKPEFSNHKAPLAAIVLLEQSSINSITLLEKKEAIVRFMARTFLPYYNTELMDIAINNLERIINTTPIYLLRCRPDREAVELVYQCIK